MTEGELHLWRACVRSVRTHHFSNGHSHDWSNCARSTEIASYSWRGGYSLFGSSCLLQVEPHRRGPIYAMNRYLIIISKLTHTSTCLCLYFALFTDLPYRRGQKHSLINPHVLLLIWYACSFQCCSLFTQSNIPFDQGINATLMPLDGPEEKAFIAVKCIGRANKD